MVFALRRGIIRSFDVFQYLQVKRIGLVFTALDIQGAQTVEEKLRQVAVGDGILTGNAFVDELPDDVAEELVDGVAVVEIINAGEQILRDGVRGRRAVKRLGELIVAETEAGLGVHDAEATATACGCGVSAAGVRFGYGVRTDCGSIGLSWVLGHDGSSFVLGFVATVERAPRRLGVSPSKTRGKGAPPPLRREECASC